ncbi:hypothetical protein JXL19_01775 [bacterium]|nr:hypothetical protein [bacterium]
MIRGHTKFLYIYIPLLLICICFIVASSIYAQFSAATLAPPNAAVGYGGLFNPYVFWPGSGLRSAAAIPALLPFGPLNLWGVGLLGNPLSGFAQAGSGIFSPAFGFGLQFGGLSPLGLNPFNPLSSYTPVTLSPSRGIAFGLSSPLRTAAQTGSWLGTWQSTYIAFPVLWNTGPMSLNIVEDPLLGIVTGTAILQDSRYASIPFDVSGVIVNDTITLEGFLYTGYDCVLTCIMTSPTTITGFYTVLGTSIPIMDEGLFNLTLNPPVLI